MSAQGTTSEPKIPLSERILRSWSAARGPLVGTLLLAATVLYAALLSPTYAVGDWLAWPTLLLWGYNIVLFTAFCATGQWLIRSVLRLELPVLETFALSIPVGMVVFVVLMHGLGAVGLFKTWAMVALTLAMIVAPVASLRRFVAEASAQARQASAMDASGLASRCLHAVIVAFGILCLGLMYLPLLSPDTVNYDATWYHQTVAQDYAREGRLVPFIADYARNFPQLSPIVHTWGYLMPVPGVLQRWTLPLHTEFFVVLATLVGISAVVRYLVAPRQPRATWVGFFLFPSIFVYDLNIGGAADHFLALFCPAVFLAAVRIRERSGPREWILFGILAGGATLTKYQSVYMLFAVTPLLAWPIFSRVWRTLRLKYSARARGESLGQPLTPWLHLVGYPLLGGVVAALILAPHCIRNLVFYGNPFYPVAQELLGGSPTVPNAAREFDLFYKDWNYRPHGPLSQQLAESIRLVFTFVFEPHYSFTKHWPNFGALFTLTMPLVVFVKRRSRVIHAFLASLVALFVWASLYRVDRNLQSVVPIIAAATTALLILIWELGAVARLGVVALVGLQVVWSGDSLFYSQESRLVSAMKLISSGYDKRLESRNEFRQPYQDIDRAVPDDAKLLMHPHPVVLGINKTMLNDLPGHQGLISYAGLGGPTAMKAYYESLGVTHVIDQVGAPASSKRDEILFMEFMRSGRSERFGHLSMLAVADSHPRPDVEHYRVFAMGIPNYKSGVYDLQKMGAYEYVDPIVVEYGTPETPMPPADEGRLPLLSEANAVLVSSPAILTSEEQATLRASFTLARQHPPFQLYLRR